MFGSMGIKNEDEKLILSFNSLMWSNLFFTIKIRNKKFFVLKIILFIFTPLLFIRNIRFVVIKVEIKANQSIMGKREIKILIKVSFDFHKN